jgi:hypothetical protein
MECARTRNAGAILEISEWGGRHAWVEVVELFARGRRAAAQAALKSSAGPAGPARHSRQ